MGDAEAVELILKIKRHVLKPQYSQSNKTLPGEILMWDNFAVLHKAAPTPLSNADGERRLLHRLTVDGLPEDRKRKRLNSSHECASRMQSSACKKKSNIQNTNQ